MQFKLNNQFLFIPLMKQLLLLSLFKLSFLNASSTGISHLTSADSLTIKDWTKEKFIEEFGTNDSAIALINMFFKKNKSGKNQIIIGGVFLIGGITSLAVPFEKNNDAKGFGDLIRPVAEPVAVSLGAIITTSGLLKLRRYTKQKLYQILSACKTGNTIPSEFQKKLKKKYFPKKQAITTRF